uniref:Integrase catalytic domain-containing protein n=1 Tax=Haemonchus contortus TaxID=6289 RepID=W6NUL9_HAECO
MFNSQNTRRQIGIQKKKLIRHIEAFNNILRDNNIPEKEATFQQFNDEEITEIQEEIADARNKLLKTYSAIERLHTEWSTAQKADPNEALEFTQYLERYGDYTKTIQEAVSALENSDSLLNRLDVEIARRHIPTRSDRYEENSRQPLEAQQQANSQPRQKSTYTTNFVDASILSRLDLPSFDGNLLEYPEFFARYSTLIGDKTELDDTTKFSLLKSCLRGRALHSIEGLALTASNYRIALDILKTRYDDKVTTRHILFSQLANLPTCDPEGKNLQSLYNKMFALTRQFCAYEDDSKEIALGAILTNKLPRHIRSRIYDATGNSHNLTPTELLNILTSIVHKEATLQEIEFHCKSFQHAREDGYASLYRSQRKKLQEEPRNQREPPYTRRIRTTKPTSEKFRRCAFCESNQHSVFHCSKFPTPQLRAQITRDKKLCFNCLSSKHRTKECPSSRLCQTCMRRHHTTLCFRTSTQQQDQRKTHYDKLQTASSNLKQKETRTQQVHYASSAVPSFEQQQDNESVGNEIVASTSSYDATPTSPSTSVLLMCAEVEVFNPNTPEQVVKTTAFLDSGSSRSYITTDLANRLALPTEETEEVSMFTFGTEKPVPLSATHHAIGLQTHKGPEILYVKAIQHLTNDLKMVTLREDIGAVTTFTTESRKPSILIGADYFWNIILSDDFYVKTLPSGYQIVHSSIGDIVTGKPLRTEEAANYCYNSTTDELKKLDKLLQRFFDLESQGIVDNDMTADDEMCMRKFNETISYDENEGRYIVQFPFKGNKEELPSNLQLAYARLVQNVRTLRQKPALLEEYHKLIQDQLTRGIIEAVDEAEPPEYCHYLAHHAVISQSSTTTKIRCVYDGSAKTKDNPSLNDLLFRGPVLLPDLTGLLLRIRTTPIIISSDIEKAFLMIGLDEESRNFTRFLWLKNPHKPISSDNVATYRFRRVPFGLIVSPFLLAGTIRHHLIMTETPLAKELIRNTYVDNIYYGVETTDQGKEFYNESKQLFLQAGMNLRQYISNSSELNNFFTMKEGTKMDENSKILGISWNVRSDQFTIKLPTLPDPDITWTKRQVLKIVAKTYDPLGWCSPVLFWSKQFLQSLWKEKLGWDEALPQHLLKIWKDITSSWTATNIKIERKLLRGTKSTSTFEIHVFTDASKAGYCAVAYLVEINESRTSSLLMSKTRLAPLKSLLTIPRLELSAINLGSMLLKHIYNNIDIPVEKTFIWSDSNVALMWIKNNTTSPVFIRNRINSIRTNAPNAILRFVPGNSNPADVGTRGVSIAQLASDDTWWKGPLFLTEAEEHWPADISSDQNHVYHHADEVHEDQASPDTLLLPERFSSWLRLLRVVYTVLHFVVKKSKGAAKHFGTLSTELYDKAEIILFRRAQNDFPPDPAIKEQLNLYFCEETKLWKSRGRVENADLPNETVSPIYLPRESYITTLYILHVHLNNNHCGINQTLTELRRKVWITKGRHTIKRVLNKSCYHCKRYTAQPFKLPEFPPHPPKRVQRPKYPFENVGMDYAGPLLNKSDEGVPAKYWIILLTCLNTRAIYVDLVPDMSSNRLLHALRRFFASVAYPKWILCDNSKTFKSIADLQSSFASEQEENPDIIDYCAQRKIEFKFIPSYSPWQGGLYEKMVHLFKVSYKHALNNRLLRMEELKTIAKETEAIVNSRPLTYVSEENYVPPLRPIDFLRPWTTLSMPRPSESDEEWKLTTTTKDSLIETWKATNDVLNRFWNRWSEEYLTSLREQYRRTHPHPRCTTKSLPKKNDVVLIQDKKLERGQWQIGQIESSTDDYQRSANVRLPSKRIITRPINLLCKLEICDSQNKTTSEGSSSRNSPQGHPMMTRSKTRAKNSGASFFSLLSLAIMATLCSKTTASTRCPSELNIPKKIIYATNCVDRGVAIATYQSSGRTQMCWFPISCPTGHIQVSIPLLQNQALCGPKCTCPTWATSCSFSTSSKKKTLHGSPTFPSTSRLTFLMKCAHSHRQKNATAKERSAVSIKWNFTTEPYSSFQNYTSPSKNIWILKTSYVSILKEFDNILNRLTVGHLTSVTKRNAPMALHCFARSAHLRPYSRLPQVTSSSRHGD